MSEQATTIIVKLQSLLISRLSRVAVLIASLVCAAAGVGSMQSAPSVSEWIDMPVAEPLSRVPEECGEHAAIAGRVIEFYSRRGEVFSPAVRIGGAIPVVSYRMLDRDIEGEFHTSIISLSEGVKIKLLDFEFSSGMFPQVREGCRVLAFPIRIDREAEPAMQRLINIANQAGRPTKWQVVQSIDITGAASESWASEEFWVIPESVDGKYLYRQTRIADPFFVGRNS
ncbi:MAG: hypothetical protein ACN4GZ_13115 [Acidimicrobiales bacterium]